jgi:hypothetical protein
MRNLRNGWETISAHSITSSRLGNNRSRMCSISGFLKRQENCKTQTSSTMTTRDKNPADSEDSESTTLPAAAVGAECLDCHSGPEFWCRDRSPRSRRALRDRPIHRSIGPSETGFVLRRRNSPFSSRTDPVAGTLARWRTSPSRFHEFNSAARREARALRTLRGMVIWP